MWGSTRPLIAVCLLLATVAALHPLAREAPRVSLRFHHLHYRVGDPGAALGEAAARLKGTRAIVQGVGVGIRVGREYLLFDREPFDARTEAASTAPGPIAAERYAEAIRWLTRSGLRASPASLRQTAVA